MSDKWCTECEHLGTGEGLCTSCVDDKNFEPKGDRRTRMTREEALEILKQFKKCLSDVVFDEKGSEAWQMAIKALSQVSEIEENIIKYMKKYPNHVGNTDFWEGFYACRNVVLQLDDEEYAPKEQEPCEKCEVGNPCLYCKHEFEPRESEEISERNMKMWEELFKAERSGKE